MKTVRVALATACALLWAVAIAAQTPHAEFEFPTYSLSPSLIGLGSVGSPLTRDGEAGLNPATLLGAPRFGVYHFDGYADYSGNLVSVSLQGWRRVAFGVSWRRFAWDRIIEDDLGVPAAGLNTGQSQYRATLAVEPIRRLHVGVAGARLVSENLGVQTTATSWSAGLLLWYAESGRVGIALLNAGAPAVASGSGDTFPLPTRLRVGAAHEFVPSATAGRLIIATDLELPPRASEAWSLHAGAEWRTHSLLTLRSGVESLGSPSAPGRVLRGSAGLALTVRSWEFGLTLRFGGVAGSQELFVGIDGLADR